MEDHCEKHASSITEPINDENDRELLSEDTEVNKDDSTPQSGPKEFEKSYCSSNSTSDLVAPETTGCVMIPESKGNESSNDIQDTSETKETGKLDAVATRCDEPLGQTFLAKNPDECPVEEDVSTASSENISQEVDEINDSVLKKHMKRKENSNNVIEGPCDKRVKGPAVGGSEVEISNRGSSRISYCTGNSIFCFNSINIYTNTHSINVINDSVPKEHMKRNANGNIVIESRFDRRVEGSAVGGSEVEISYRNPTRTSYYTGTKSYFNMKNVSINSHSTGGIYMKSCKNVSINSGSTGGIVLKFCKDVCINTRSTSGIVMESCANVRINSGSTSKIFTQSCKNVRIASGSTGRIFAWSSNNVCITSGSTGRVFNKYCKNFWIKSGSTGGAFIEY